MKTKHQSAQREVTPMTVHQLDAAMTHQFRDPVAMTRRQHVHHTKLQTRDQQREHAMKTKHQSVHRAQRVMMFTRQSPGYLVKKHHVITMTMQLAQCQRTLQKLH
jgi:hypothetical protein